MTFLGFISNVIRKYPKQFLLMLFFLLIQNLFDMASVLSMAPLVDLMTKPNLVGVSSITSMMLQLLKYVHLSPTIYSIMFMILVFFLIRVILNIIVNRFILKIKYLIIKDLMCGTYQDVFNANNYFFSSNSRGVLGNTFMGEISKVGDILGSLGTMFIRIFQIVFYFALPLVISWQLSLTVLLLGTVFSLPFSMLGKVMHNYGKMNLKTANRIFEIVQETLAMAKIIVGYGEQKKNISMLSKVVDEHVAVTIKSQLIDRNSPIIYQFFSMIIVLLSLVLSQSVFNIPFANATVILYSFYLGLPFIGQLISLKNSIMPFFPSYEQVVNMRLQAKQEKQASGNVKFCRFNESIVFDNVNFAYRNQDNLLRNINIEILKGKMVAFIGKSGAGKSTLIDMLMGFYSPDSGSILIDGVDLREYEIVSWRKKLGYVPQECALFNMSLRDNLKWAKEDATDDEIIDACELANVNEFLSDLPLGLDSMVGDRGTLLSGGQRQRVALARAILRKPEILILDEATSSLDSHSERLIQEAIENIAHETTVVVVAHRLSTIMNADHIFVIANGAVVEKGSFSDLCAKKGPCYELARIQGMA